ncbi:hypothetical protein IHE61_25505 [Streptomyces sp. GKU 257-1]|nr:hypothetical protein [Streptomyces sp. GKU 257-1]
MIDALGRGAHVLKSADGWSRQFSGFGADTTGLSRLVAIGNWADQQLPSLKRRFDLAVAIEQNHPDAGRTLVRVPDDFLSLEAAQRKGKELADRMNRVNRVDGSGAEEIHRIAGELARFQDDPEVLAAFYAQLGPNRLSTLPMFLYQSGSGTGKEDLRTFSRGLGTASSATFLAAPGFDKVTQMMLRPSENPSDAWGRLALMQHGHFPTEYIRKAAKNLALDGFVKDPDGTDWRGTSLPQAAALGLSEDNLALALNLLGKDGAAARDVLRGMHQGDLKKTYDLLLGYARSRGGSGDAVAAGLGRAMEAGSGVGTEEPGRHSLTASQFAFHAMTYMAGRGEDGTPWSMKVSMANLGASYIHELTTGARDDDAPLPAVRHGPARQLDRPAGPEPRLLPEPAGHLQVPDDLRGEPAGDGRLRSCCRGVQRAGPPRCREDRRGGGAGRPGRPPPSRCPGWPGRWASWRGLSTGHRSPPARTWTSRRRRSAAC